MIAAVAWIAGLMVGFGFGWFCSSFRQFSRALDEVKSELDEIDRDGG